ncbi:phosphoheptose isomerase family protein [Streptomyces triticirhizae]|uniref:hypothetical protein n=1 Tax=Streptomyces triticirhizae TaxID=2483353 RepID=UPI0018F414ED|nr:hypothetical protein [Streptomyces triticirhizae]
MTSARSCPAARVRSTNCSTAASSSPDSAPTPGTAASEAPAPAPLRPHILLFRDPPPNGAPGGLPSAADAARDLAFGRGVGLDELSCEEGEPLVAVAELLARTDFAAVYLTLAAGHHG